MAEVKPESEDPTDLRIFLAGSIEMGTAPQWQRDVVDALSVYDGITVYNPRRDDWNSSWVQSPDNPQFRKQVEWELEKIGLSDIIFFYFAPNTQSPVSMLELGLALASSSIVIVACPDGFHRKGNIQITCERVGVKIHSDLNSAFTELDTLLEGAGF